MSDSNFNTPPDILDRVRVLDVKNGIGLDPCSNRTSMVKARTEYGTVFDGGGDVFIDGLKMPWRGHGLTFMNPPHSMSPNNIEPWMAKAWDEFVSPYQHQPLCENDRQFDQFIGLIPAKPDTAWFHDHVVPFPVKCFLRGRPKFWLNGEPTKGPGKFPSMLIYQGHQPDVFRELFEGLGWVV